MEPLQALRRIFTEAEGLESADELLNLIVARVKESTGSDVCSIYLQDEAEDDWVLVASEGLAGDAVGAVRMRSGDGLVGHICETQTLLNLEDGSKDPRYRYFPETGEEHFSGFLGVPIISFRRLIGVLVVQCKDKRQFVTEDEAFLITIAAQLAGPLSTVLKQESLSAIVNKDVSGQIKVSGVKGAAGISIGIVKVVSPFRDLACVNEEFIENVDAEVQNFHEAVASVKLEIEAGEDKLASSLTQEVQALFGVYLMLLENDAIVVDTVKLIKEGYSASYALKRVIDKHAKQFEAMDDPYLRARSEDIRHLGLRIYASLNAHDYSVQLPEEPFVLLSKNLSITDIAQYANKHLKGLICIDGSVLSHTAVLASALGITAIMGVGDITLSKVEGSIAVMDGYRAQVIFNASSQLQQQYQRLAAQENRLIAGLEKLKDLPAETSDGRRINLYANTGLLADLNPGLERGAEGVGLYRSEIPFMLHETFPTEDEQTEVYRKVLEAYAPRSVYMRTLDIGGDKALPYFSFEEDNPYLGWRGIRFTLDNSSIFLAQIRALLRANLETKNMKIMLPMVSRVEEVDAFRDLLEQARAQLETQGMKVPKPRVGIMVEVPAAMMALPHLSKRIDFISIGSNDLTQYLLAVDRNNPKVSDLYNFLNPAVLSAVNHIVASAQDRRLKVSLCGEMASDPAAVILLLGMGINTLSMSAFNIPKVKWVIRTFTHARAKQLLYRALNLESESCIREMLELELESCGLGGLIRAGG